MAQLTASTSPARLGPSYTINNVQAADAGTYSVVIASFAGSVVTPTPRPDGQHTPGHHRPTPKPHRRPGRHRRLFRDRLRRPPADLPMALQRRQHCRSNRHRLFQDQCPSCRRRPIRVLVSNPFGSASSINATLDVVSPNPSKPALTSPSGRPAPRSPRRTPLPMPSPTPWAPIMACSRTPMASLRPVPAASAPRSLATAPTPPNLPWAGALIPSPAPSAPIRAPPRR